MDGNPLADEVVSLAGAKKEVANGRVRYTLDVWRAGVSDFFCVLVFVLVFVLLIFCVFLPLFSLSLSHFFCIRSGRGRPDSPALLSGPLSASLA
jgi:hypothetical protein